MRARATPYLMLAPFLAGFGLFMLYPLARAAWLALHRPTSDGLRFAPAENVAFLLGDPLFWLALANTVGFAVLYLLLQAPLALGVALLLDRADVRARSLWRLAFFSTHLVGTVFVAIVAGVLVSGRRSVVNRGLDAVGIEPIDFLQSPGWAMPLVLIAALWLCVGYAMVYLLAALQGVDRSHYDAAAVDGAGPWSRLRHVTLPGIAPVFGYLSIVGLIGALQLFELPFVLFGGPGPGYRGVTVVMYLFGAAFDAGDLPNASTVGWALAVVIGVVAIGGWKLLGRLNHDA